jgi:hypothetical protein
MTVTVYRSTDASAPTLNGTAGSLCTVLDAILVDGYGAKPGAGWSKILSSTSNPLISGGTAGAKRIYRCGSGAMRPYLRVHDDSQNVFALGREARLRGFEGAESSFDLNIGAFPTLGQAANGIIYHKSAWTDTAARPWVAIADDRTIYFFSLPGDYIGYASFMFGEYYSLKSTTDSYNGMIIGRITERTAAAAALTVALSTQETLETLSVLPATVPGHFTARGFGEHYQPSMPVGKHGSGIHSATTLSGLFVYPNSVDAGLYLSQVWVHEPLGNSAVVRGRLRGFWHFLHPVGVQVADGDMWNGTGALAGKTFMAIKPTAQGAGVFVIETSNTWETN